MNSQIYLLLVRQSGSWKDVKETKLLAVPMLLKQVLKDMVMGDSLDIPFIKFIRCHNVSHGISFSGLDTRTRTHKQKKYDTEETQMLDSDGEVTTDAKKQGGNKFRSYGTSNIRKQNFYLKGSGYDSWSPNKGESDYSVDAGIASWMGGNEFIKNQVPSHGEISFSKSIDTATPQLAYGCAAQEQFPLAVFFYRRKAGLGIAGVRWPYFVMGLYKCKIKDWSLDGDSETANLSYKSISWCGYDQWADTNISYPWSTRWFDQDACKGGQGGWAAIIQALAAGLIMGAAGLTAAATAGS